MRTVLVLPNHKVAKEDTFLDWLREHDIKPEDCFRLDMNANDMVVHCYKRNAQGSKYVIKDVDDPHCGEAAIEEPRTVVYKRRYWIGASP